MEKFDLVQYPNLPLCMEYADGRRQSANLDSIIELLASPGDIPKVIKREYLFRNAVQISITSACNCNCLHCYAADENGHMTGQFNIGEISHILDESLAVGIKTVELTGGEPLIHPDFEEILRLIHDKSMALRMIYTNSMYVDEKLLKLLNGLGFSPCFSISFDGLGIHDSFRGVNGMEKIVLEKLKLVHNAGFQIRCNINVNHLTLPVLIETARFLAVNFKAELFLIRTSPSPRLLIAAPDIMMSFNEYFEACLDVVATDVNEKWNVPIRMLHVPTVPANLDMKPVFDTWHENRECPMSRNLMGHCPKASSMIYVAHDGRVLPCDGYEGASLARGFLNGDDINIFKHPLKDILTSSEYRNIFNTQVKDLVSNEPECRNCRWLSICRGGCRLISLYGHEDNNQNHRSVSNCTFFRGGYAERFEALFR